MTRQDNQRVACAAARLPGRARQPGTRRPAAGSGTKDDSPCSGEHRWMSGRPASRPKTPPGPLKRLTPTRVKRRRITGGAAANVARSGMSQRRCGGRLIRCPPQLAFSNLLSHTGPMLPHDARPAVPGPDWKAQRIPPRHAPVWVRIAGAWRKGTSPPGSSTPAVPGGKSPSLPKVPRNSPGRAATSMTSWPSGPATTTHRLSSARVTAVLVRLAA